MTVCVCLYAPPSLTRICISMTVSVCLYAPLLSNPYLYKYDCVCLSLRSPSLTRICISMTVCVCLYVPPL